jgi:hypothetical protein
MKFILTLTLCLFSFSTFATEGEESAKEKAINLVIEKSGISRQVEQIPNQFMQNIQQKAAAVGEGGGVNTIFASLADAVQHAYNIDKIKEEVSEHLSKSLTDDDVIAILEWFASEEGQFITQQEIKASTAATTPAGMAEMSAFLENLSMVEPDSARKAIITDLNEAVKATEFVVDTTLNTTIAFMKAMQQTLPQAAGQPSQEQEALEQIEAQRAVITPILQQAVEKTLLYTYKDTNDETLKAYVEFCKSNAGSKFYQASLSALKGAMGSANTELAMHFANSLKELNNAR